MDRVIKNQNVIETEHDKQFKDDLEKATALSLETLALEQFRRNRSSAGGDDLSTGSNSMRFSSCMFSS